MLNKVILVGNVGRTPEIRVLETGSKMARFTLATNESYFTADGQRAIHTEWHNIVLWRGAADYAEKFIKVGCEIYIEGTIRSRQSVDPRSKLSTTIYEIIGHTVRLSNAQIPQEKAQTSDKEIFETIIDPDGLPF